MGDELPGPRWCDPETGDPYLEANWIFGCRNVVLVGMCPILSLSGKYLFCFLFSVLMGVIGIAKILLAYYARN